MLIRVLVLPVGKPPEVREIDNGLEAMQAIVGGYIETVSLDGSVAAVVNEDGPRLHLPNNRIVGHSVVVGQVFVVRFNDEGEFVSLTDEDVARWSEKFADWIKG